MASISDAYYEWRHGEGIQLSKNFHASEFECHCGTKHVNRIATELIACLQMLRDEYGPIKINSGYRCEVYNEKVGGSFKSQHMLGTAADLHFYNQKDLLFPYSYAHHIGLSVGLYETSNFIHVDVRGEWTCWRGK